MSDAPLIKVADAWERERRGNKPGTYIVAVAGGLKFLLLRENREEENGSTWTLFVTARGERRDQPTRGQSTWNATERPPEAMSAADRAAHVEQLSAAFQPDEEI
jgi:hypothetical protein